MAVGVPGRLRPRIFSTFGITRAVGRQPNAPATFTPGEIPGNHFQRLSRPQGTWFCGKEPRKKSQVTPPVIDPGTVRLVAQRLNLYATTGLLIINVECLLFLSAFDGKLFFGLFFYPQNTKFHENPSSDSRVVSCGRADRRRDGPDETDSRFSQFCDIS